MDLQQGSCGGRELIRGCSAVPPPVAENHPKETQQQEHTKHSSFIDPRTTDLFYLYHLMDTRPLCVLCWVPEFGSSPALGGQTELRLCRHFSTGLFLRARPRSGDELCSSGRLRAAGPGHSPAPRHPGSCCSCPCWGKSCIPHGAPLSLSARQTPPAWESSFQIPPRPVWSLCSPTNQSLDHGRAQ